jgi:hypothetical protein
VTKQDDLVGGSERQWGVTAIKGTKWF